MGKIFIIDTDRPSSSRNLGTSSSLAAGSSSLKRLPTSGASSYRGSFASKTSSPAASTSSGNTTGKKRDSSFTARRASARRTGFAAANWNVCPHGDSLCGTYEQRRARVRAHRSLLCPSLARLQSRATKTAPPPGASLATPGTITISTTQVGGAALTAAVWVARREAT